MESVSVETLPPAVSGGVIDQLAEPNPYEKSNLTANQLQVWLAQNLLPEVPVFNLAVGLQLDGRLDIGCFKRAFSVLIDSSDALRTAVREIDGIPWQRVLPDAASDIELVDFSRSPSGKNRAQNWMEARCRTPLDWSGRLFDSALIRLAEDQFIWYLNVHHLICDGWSFELIYRRMADLYLSAREGRLPKTIDLPRFADYVAWERDHRESPRYRKTAEYWQRFVAEPGDRVDFYGRVPLVMTTEVRRVSHDLGRERTQRLKAAAKVLAGGTSQAAPFDVFAAVLIGYLHCLNGYQSYTIGVPFHNRRSGSSFKQTIGFFSEVLPVRVGLGEDETFASLIRKFDAEVRRTLRYGQYAVTNPLFNRVYDVTLNYHTRSFSDFAGIRARPEWIHSGHGDESLGIQVHDFASAESLALDFDLHQAVFDGRDCERVVAHYLRVLDAFLDWPEMPLRRLSLASEEEKRRALAPCATPTGISEQRSVHQLFEQRVRERPDQPAVLSDGEKLTYRELDHRAASIARLLHAQGVRPGDLVVTYVTRTPVMIAAMLGVLKAGAAYVPADPQYSSEWLKFILDDTAATVLLTERRLLADLPANAAGAICLDDEVPGSDEAIDEPGAAVCGDDLAYVIYTSGSTGTPKGVAITHAALTNFAKHAAGAFKINSGDRVLQFASIAFDTSVEEIFPCLISGAALVLRPDSLPTGAAAFLDQCRAWGVTVLDLPTAYWHELTIELFAARLTLSEPIRLVIIGGERAIPERLALWQAFVGGKVRLLNTYGPTEATVAATMADLTDAPAECGGAGEVAIGRPIANVQALVLDRNLNPAPEGVPGELYIGGAGLARGYLGRADLTAERFIPDPFAAGAGSRLYRTGDIARYRDDGNIEFLCRDDDQVKIRGFRVEPEGIAAVLRQHPLVRDAAVTSEGSGASARLVAYVVPEGAGVLNLKDVQSFVRARLPDFMVPAELVPLNVLPLTPRGKLDRGALRFLREGQCTTSGTFVPPQTPVEELIAKLWRELLSLDAVGRNQHFFEIGGHSLLAARAAARIGREFGAEIPLRAIFEAPTIESLAERVEQILRQRPPVADTPVVVGSHNGHAPASDSQSRIWYMDQLAPESTAYNIAAAVRFTGTLDREALRQSLDRLVERHESLRTTIKNEGGEPVQVIAPGLRLALPEIDLGETPPELRLDRAKQILREEGRRPFNLSRGPLLRVLLLQLDDRDHVLLLSMHHLISDQWSLGVIAREICSFYNAWRGEGASPLDPPPAQYGDFAIWQSGRLTQERLRTDLAYWKRQLAGVQPAAVPTDRPRPAVQSFSGAHQTLTLSRELIAKLQRIAVDENATLYMVFLAAFKILLSRYSGRDDVALGSPVANRSRPEWEDVIGTFINLLVLRTDLAGNPSLREIVRRVREVALDAFTHQEVPFHKLVEELAPGRDASRSPLVQILFNFQSTPVGTVQFDGISWAPLEIEQWASQFDLSVTIDPEITRKVFISYNTDLYDQATVARLLGHYGDVLEALATDAQQSLDTISLLIGAEREPRDNRLAYPEKCFHELFEEQAERSPDAAAVVYGDQQVTYGELNRRANRLARRLRARGVGAEDLVGICAERSSELVAGLLAIAKAGGAYVPIDPAYPSERIGFILNDSGLGALVTEKSLLAQLPESDLPVLLLDERFEPDPGADADLEPLAGPDQLAYVIYTSGSTGRPKGVQIPHRALVSFLCSMKERPGIDPTDVLLSVTTISFDIAALELFLPLVTGASVVVASRETAADGKALVAQLGACGASVMQATPTTWRMMIEAGWQGSSDFKAICGGESLPPDLARELTSRCSSVWNLYGPTETTVWSSIWKVESPCEKVAIGQPIHNTGIYLLDTYLRPVPVGVEGEIYIGGEGLARGYLHRPELTAEKFVPNPFGAQSSRLYRTGDWGRYSADGTIEFLGRIDNQVKLRGFRIELGEVEVVLSAHEDVKQAVVVMQGEGADKRLVAYLVAREGRSLKECDVCSLAKNKLPGYMVPSVFVSLEQLPLTPNGKIDRRVLAMAQIEIPAKLSKANPTDRVEFELTHLWKKYLRIACVGRHDNFFDIGGDSLRAPSLVAQIEKRFGKTVRLRDFLANPTVQGVALLLRKTGHVTQWSFLFPIQSYGSRPPFFWVHGGASNFLLPAYLGEDQPVYGFMHQSQDGRPAQHTTVEEIAAHYLQELCSVQPDGPYFLGGYSFGGLVAFEMAQQLRARGEEVTLLGLLDPTSPGNRSPLARPGGGNFIERLSVHFQSLRSLTVRSKLGYISSRLIGKATRFVYCFRIKSIKVRLWRVGYSFCIGFGCKMFWRFRAFYLSDLYERAAWRYKPVEYPGRVVLFKSLGNPHDHVSRWKQMVSEKGNLEIHLVAGNHKDVVIEPQAKIWATKLSSCLQSQHAGKAKV